MTASTSGEERGESAGRDSGARVVLRKGRARPLWFGHPVGRWDGDTLVVDTTGFNDKTNLDTVGHPHSDALHIVERFRRPDFGHMVVEVTIDDPKAYTKPWTVSIPWNYVADTELLDWVCENNKDPGHMVGK